MSRKNVKNHLLSYKQKLILWRYRPFLQKPYDKSIIVLYGLLKRALAFLNFTSKI